MVISQSNQAGPMLHVLWNMEIGGAERALFQLVREQRARGIHADVLLGSHAGPYGERTRELGARVIELFQKGTFDRSAAGRFHEAVRDYSIIHFHCAEPLLIHLASRERHLRRFYTHRAGMFAYGWKQMLRYRLIGRHLRRDFHGISGNTGQACDAAAKLFDIPRDTIRVTYNGIDFSLLDPLRPRDLVLDELNDHRGDIIRVGTSANLRTLKRIDLLIDAMAMLDRSDIHCHIFGEGPARASLEAQVRSLGLQDRVTFAGKKSHMGDYLQLLDIFVLPSGPEESFGNSAVEAMGVGIPTIIFADGGGLVEHLEDERTGFVVKNREELAARMKELIEDESLRRKIGDAGRGEMRARYNPGRMVERYAEMYEV